MTPWSLAWLSLAALFLVKLVRTLVHPDSPLHARRPLGCDTCMSGWSALAVSFMAFPPWEHETLRWIVPRWLCMACVVWLALEALNRLGPAAHDMLPPE